MIDFKKICSIAILTSILILGIGAAFGMDDDLKGVRGGGRAAGAARAGGAFSEDANRDAARTPTPDDFLSQLFEDRSRATPFPSQALSHEHNIKGKSFGQIIEEQESSNRYDAKTPVMQSCLSLARGLKGSDGKSKFLTPSEVINFFQTQGLVPYVENPQKTPGGLTKTYAHTCGVEFETHGPLADRVESLIRAKILGGGGSRVHFMDYGAGEICCG